MNRSRLLCGVLLAGLTLPALTFPARRPAGKKTSEPRSSLQWLEMAGRNWVLSAREPAAGKRMQRALRGAAGVAAVPAEAEYLNGLAREPLDEGAGPEWLARHELAPPPILLLTRGGEREGWILEPAGEEGRLLPGMEAVAAALARSVPAAFKLGAPLPPGQPRVVPARGGRPFTSADRPAPDRLLVPLPETSSPECRAVEWVLTDRLNQKFRQRIRPLVDRGLVADWHAWVDEGSFLQLGLLKPWTLSLALGAGSKAVGGLPAEAARPAFIAICEARASALALWGALRAEVTSAWLEYGFSGVGAEAALPAPLARLLALGRQAAWLGTGTALLLDGAVEGATGPEPTGRRILLWHLIRSGALLAGADGRATLAPEALAGSLESFLAKTGTLLAQGGASELNAFLAEQDRPPPYAMVLRQLVSAPHE
ncbi:MAG TPA: hypothetical protein PKK12_01795 [Candidatus Aminicenantes bacterium]|nr:hypothetical protein [Candidatus Aminicenantes bacterium]